MDRYLQWACILAAITPTGVVLPQVSIPPESEMSFELASDSAQPIGWRIDLPETVALDSESPVPGETSVRIERNDSHEGTFSSITRSIPVWFAGTSIEISGMLRTREVAGFAGLWLRQDGPAGALILDNMQQQQVDGTRDWSRYRIRLPLLPDAESLYFGVLLAGEGTVWADDIELLVDGVPLADAPERNRPATVLDTDTEFTNGSGISIDTLSSVQVDHLLALAQVWGFMKYHHPVITGGALHWDFELFRVLPALLAAADADARNAVLLEWVQRVGNAPACEPCASRSDDIVVDADLTWLDDPARLGEALTAYLRSTHARRSGEGGQFYVRTAAQGGLNAIFSNEPAYEHLTTPDAGYRLLSLFRLWNAAQYWFPYRDLMDRNWDTVLREQIPGFTAAETREAYLAALWQVTAALDDTHGGLLGAGAGAVIPPTGSCRLPVKLRFAGSQPVVAGFGTAAAARDAGLMIGDVLTHIDGRAIERLIDEWQPYYPASNRAAMLRNMSALATRGACGEATVAILRDDEALEIPVQRIATEAIEDLGAARHDRSGNALQWLTPDIAYMNLGITLADDVTGYVEALQNARAVILDIRNYPRANLVFSLGRHLVTEPTAIAKFSRPDLTHPGAFVWGFTSILEPMAPVFSGRIAILVDENTQSAAEYTAMAIRAAPDAIVVGSQTAGADGNVSMLQLPGGLTVRFSGLGVFYADGTPTQRIGIVPDIHVEPTPAGIRDGRDEVLERALIEVTDGALGPAAAREIARQP